MISAQEQIIAASGLICERCHGTTYVSTALGKLPCLACSTSEYVSTGQEKSEVVSNRQDETAHKKISALVEQKGAVTKNSENVVPGGQPGFGFRVDGIDDRAVIENFAVSADRVPGTPFASVNAELKHMRLNGHDVFVASGRSAHL